MVFLLPLLFALAPQAPVEAETTTTAETTSAPARIQWFGTLAQGLAEAKRTNRPILMTAAAPSCGTVAGKW